MIQNLYFSLVIIHINFYFMFYHYKEVKMFKNLGYLTPFVLSAMLSFFSSSIEAKEDKIFKKEQVDFIIDVNANGLVKQKIPAGTTALVNVFVIGPNGLLESQTIPGIFKKNALQLIDPKCDTPTNTVAFHSLPFEFGSYQVGATIHVNLANNGQQTGQVGQTGQTGTKTPSVSLNLLLKAQAIASHKNVETASITTSQAFAAIKLPSSQGLQGIVDLAFVPLLLNE